jgi:hypothetical protein
VRCVESRDAHRPPSPLPEGRMPGAVSIPIPPPIWRRLIRFLELGRTGRVTLNVFEGRVLTADINDRVTAEDAIDEDLC